MADLVREEITMLLTCCTDQWEEEEELGYRFSSHFTDPQQESPPRLRLRLLVADLLKKLLLCGHHLRCLLSLMLGPLATDTGLGLSLPRPI